MKKTFYGFFFFLIIISSCGVIMDQTGIAGEWELDGVEFYVQNTNIDAVKTYYGKDGTSPSSSKPMISEFFEHGEGDNTTDRTYIINFDKSHQLEVYADDGNSTTDDTIVSLEGGGRWELNQFDNSLLLHVKDNSDSLQARGIWKDGFKTHLSWPMVDYDTLELHIKANDVGKRYFSVELPGKTLKVKSMKGIFKKK